MVKVQIFELNPAGFDLLTDPENFLQELEEDELTVITGGIIKNSLISNIQSLHTHSRISLKASAVNEASVVSELGNSVNNNTVNGHTHNANSYGNFNTVA